MAFGVTDIQGQVFGSVLVRVYGANGKQKFPAGGGGVTSVTATSPITSSGGLTPVISTLMNTNRLIGRGSAGTGVMEEITLGTGLDLSGTTLNVGNIDLAVLATSTTTERLDNWAPVGWPGTTDIIKVIHHTPNITNKINIISGLANGTAGRIVSIRNMSTDNLILLENGGTGSLAANRFRFDGRGAYFLFPEETVTLLYDGVEWAQFGSKTNNGHDYYEDFLGVNYGAAVTSAFSNTGFALATGTGALARNENPLSQAIGTIGLSTGTTTTGASTIKSNPRGQWNLVTGGGGSKALVVSRLQLPTAPTVAENWYAMMGVSQTALSSGVNFTSGVGWVADINSTFWQCRAANTSNTIISTTISALPLSTNSVVLGCWYPNTNGDCVYFYSADGGVVYTVNSMFVRVSSAYGGAPSMGIQKSAGTTSRTLDVDYLALSKKGGTI
jgi:hypothetical protein